LTKKVLFEYLVINRTLLLLKQNYKTILAIKQILAMVIVI